MNNQLTKKQKIGFLTIILLSVSIFIISSGGDGPSEPSKPTYKIDFTDGSSFYAEDFSRIDVKGAGGKGCVEFKAITDYTSTDGKVTKKGENLLHCGTYTFAPPYQDNN